MFTDDPRGKVLAVLLACATLTVMAGATIAPALPGLQAHFDGVPGASAWVPLILTIPGLAIALCSPIAGWLVDRSAKRRVLLVGVALYIAAGSSGLYLDSIGQILLGRILLGVSVACVMTAAMALIAGLYTDAERGQVLGYQAAAMSFGGVLFIMAGGFLADVSWRAPFGVYLVPLLLFPLIFMLVPRGEPEVRATKGADAPAESFPFARASIIYVAAFANFIVFYTIPLKLPFALNAMGVESAALAGGAIALLTL
ncbi:MAG: MFS transporter, partial [Pseudomonadota bacterium]